MGRCIEIVTSFDFVPDEQASEEGRQALACEYNQDLPPYELCMVEVVWMGRILWSLHDQWVLFGMRDPPRFPDSYDGYLVVFLDQFRSDYHSLEEQDDRNVEAFQKLLRFVGRETIRDRQLQR